MNASAHVLARVLAWQRRRAIPIRTSASLSPDPEVAFGIAPIKVVSEEVVYAIAFGRIDHQPNVLTRWNPLGRESQSFTPFAAALVEYFELMLAASLLPRIWLPHMPAFEAIELLGYRYERNPAASALVQRMGRICRIIAEEGRLPGQQLVAIAGELLATHVATGQSPTEDRHLGAILAWTNPVANKHPADEAAERSINPLSSILSRADDDRVEFLHHRAKKLGGRAGSPEIAEIESIVGRAACREWEMMLEGRLSYLSLGLEWAGAEEAAELSLDRVNSRFLSDAGAPRSPHGLAIALTTEEFSLQLQETSDLHNDSISRALARLAGRSVAGRIVLLERPSPRCGVHRIVVRTEQSNLHIRVDDRLQSVGGEVEGVLRDIATDGVATLLTIQIESGKRAAVAWQPGAQVEWLQSKSFPLGRRQAPIFQMRDRQPPLVYGRDVPIGHLTQDLPNDLAAATLARMKP